VSRNGTSGKQWNRLRLTKGFAILVRTRRG